MADTEVYQVFHIPVSWTMVGEMVVRAKTREEAEEIARQTPRLPDGDYLEDSFQVDPDQN